MGSSEGNGTTKETHTVLAGRIHQINRSGGGVPKLPVPEAEVTEAGVAGDRQANRKFHGGPDRALCLFALETIEELRAEGHPIAPGATGENITTEGIDWSALAPGAVLRLGAEVLIEITSYTTPCKTISGSFSDGRFVRISEKLHPGSSRLYARVLRGGRVAVGDPIHVCDMPAPRDEAERS
jgi:MOSC domain-containing protein YiiM